MGHTPQMIHLLNAMDVHLAEFAHLLTRCLWTVLVTHIHLVSLRGLQNLLSVHLVHSVLQILQRRGSAIPGATLRTALRDAQTVLLASCVQGIVIRAL